MNQAAAVALLVGMLMLVVATPDAAALPGGLQTPSATPGMAACQPPPPAIPTSAAPGEEDSLLGPTPTPAPDPAAIVDPVLDTMTTAAAATLEACWNAADWPAVAALLTPRFLETAFGIDDPDQGTQATALAALELGPLRIEAIGPVGFWSDGRGAVEVFYERGRGQPAQAVAARWFLVAERGIVHFDEETLLSPPALGDRTTVGFSIPDDLQPLRWDNTADGLVPVPVSPVIAVHGANRGRISHTFVLQDHAGATAGLLTLPPWRQGDLLLLNLPVGTYRLLDPAVPDSEIWLEVVD